jgi:hypothetical protein
LTLTGDDSALSRDLVPIGRRPKGGEVKVLCLLPDLRSNRFNLVGNLAKFSRQSLETVIDHFRGSGFIVNMDQRLVGKLYFFDLVVLVCVEL